MRANCAVYTCAISLRALTNMLQQTVEVWLDSLGLGHLSSVFRAHNYSDVLMIQEMGLTSEDLTFMGIMAQGERRLLKVMYYLMLSNLFLELHDDSGQLQA
jgi:SAM domain (Sterile alpha motif)